MRSWSLQEGSSSVEIDCDRDDDGDFVVSIRASVEGFVGHAGGHVVGAEWTSFLDALRRLELTRKGEARFASAYPGEFELRVHSIDSRGHLGLSGMLRFGRRAEEWPHQQLRFALEFEPMKLPLFVRSIAA
jgi:hypothetical protein